MIHAPVFQRRHTCRRFVERVLGVAIGTQLPRHDRFGDLPQQRVVVFQFVVHGPGYLKKDDNH